LFYTDPSVFEQEKDRIFARTWQVVGHRDQVAKPGDYTALSRATDSQGRVQPEAPVWNPSGYLYNAYDQVTINVQA